MQFGERIKELRESQGLLQRQLAASLEIDTPMFSKIERGDRRAKREQVLLLSKLLKVNEKELLTLWLADQVYELVKDEDVASNALRVAEENFHYGKSQDGKASTF
ncbi:MAG: helix-turn-helix transcriptional regulator [Bacteroidota bacterium]